MENRTVLCAGDSITYGYLLGPEESYPSVLQNLLGNNYTVINSSNVGLTAYDYAQLFDVEENVDIAVLMFGSNDSNSAFFESKEQFKNNYERLFEMFDQSKIYLCTPCKAYSTNYGVDEENLEIIVEAIQELGKEYNYVVIDIYKLTSNHPEWFENDGIHPSAQGAKAIAQEVYKSIK
ncbi:MAG: GDSL-type esterase/lipase family protein [Bacillota bacterium]|nr:GDSL-type esterase/lipase family protein [Bacillota bacterium]